MNAQAEELVLSKKMSQLDKQYNKSIELQEELKESKCPMNKLSKEISASIPDELTGISSLQYLEIDQLTLTLETLASKAGVSVLSLSRVSEEEMLEESENLRSILIQLN